MGKKRKTKPPKMKSQPLKKEEIAALLVNDSEQSSQSLTSETDSASGNEENSSNEITETVTKFIDRVNNLTEAGIGDNEESIIEEQTEIPWASRGALRMSKRSETFPNLHPIPINFDSGNIQSLNQK